MRCITYDGLLELLGQSQVLAYMEKLPPELPAHILSFEKSKDRDDEARMATMRAQSLSTGKTTDRHRDLLFPRDVEWLKQ
jgi:hypothetical protein